MKVRKIISNLVGDSRGASAIIAAIILVVMVGFASLAIDVGQLYTVRNQLQNNADAAALAAVSNLVVDQGGVAVRDATAAQNAAVQVAQRQSQLSNQPAVDDSARSDLTITFGVWDLRAASKDVAWTEIGPSCPSSSNANAARVTIHRAAGTTYGAVTNFLASIFGAGFSTSAVRAEATAYLGYTSSTVAGTVAVPLAIPDSLLTAAKQERSTWWARLFFSSQANATGPKTIIFKDLGSGSFYQSNLSQPLFDTAKGYLFLVSSSDSSPGTVYNNIQNNYTTGGTPVRAMARGSQLYPISEYLWASNNKTIFSYLQSAYNAKKQSGKWRVLVPVYATHNPLAQRMWRGVRQLVAWFDPLPKAHACMNFWTQTYPGGNVPIYVAGFVNVDITNVTYNSNCDDCSSYSPAKDGKKYSSTDNCTINNPLSCRNTNSITIQIPVDSSTVSPGGSMPAAPSNLGPSNHDMNSNAPSNVGAFAAVAKLVK